MGDIVALFKLSVPFLPSHFSLRAARCRHSHRDGLFLFFWPIFFIGLWLWFISAWFASFSLLIGQDAIILSTYKGERKFLFLGYGIFSARCLQAAEMADCGVMVRRAFRKRFCGDRRCRQSHDFGSSASGSIGIRMRDGSDVFINVTDQMGNNALKDSIRSSKI